jgi:integrase
MRVLRAIRNKAEKRGLVSTEPDLFDRLCTGSEPTRKRALPNGVILRLSRVDLSAHPHLAAGREIFMLLFFLQGMSFVDLAHLRKSDLKNGYITYRRRKSGAPVSVKVWPPARALLERYLNRDKDSPYLLSILEDGAQYRTLLRRFNRHLNALGELLGLGESLTSYVARHSWATAAYRIGVPTALIGEAMGHKTEEVTRVYLASFDTETMDYAGRMVWESLFKDETADKETKKHHRKGKQDWIRDVSLLAGERHDSDANVKRSF